jgi:hypothetical protein
MTDRISTGGDMDSYCTKCKLNLEHIILAMVGGKVVKVQCKTCGSIHRFKGMPAVKAVSPRKAGAAARSSVSNQALWETAISEADGQELPYNMANTYRPGDVIVHSIFGKGVVQKTLFEKCSVLFRDRERLLATANT